MKNPYYPFSIEVSGFTSLKAFEDIYYKNNIDYYNKFKTKLIVCSFIFSLLFVLLIILTNGWLQTLASTLLGATFSLITWVFSVKINDEMNYRINQIDNLIFKIDRLLQKLQEPEGYYKEGLKIIKIDTNNLVFRLCNLSQVIVDLSSINEIDSKELEFKSFNTTNINVSEMEELLDEMITNKNLLDECLIKRLSNFICYNEKYLKDQLNGLKNVLLKRKGYILCGKAPFPYEEAQKRIKKAELFDKIFNFKQEKN